MANTSYGETIAHGDLTRVVSETQEDSMVNEEGKGAEKKVSATAGAEGTPKRRGRPPKPPIPYDGPTFGLEKAQVTEAKLDELDLADTTFQCRVTLKPELLVDSIRTHGIQVPLVVRDHPRKKGRYQLVCGFRRATAAGLAGLAKVPVVVRELSNEQAHILSFAENEYRKTLNDLDRAHAIVKLQRSGKDTAKVAQLYRLSERQVQRLRELVDYPPEVRKAMADEETTGVTSTHAMVLMGAQRKYRARFDLKEWLVGVRKMKMSVDDLRRSIRQEFGGRRPRFSFSRRGDRIVVNVATFRAAPEGAQARVIEQLELLVKQLKQHRRTAAGKD